MNYSAVLLSAIVIFGNENGLWSPNGSVPQLPTQSKAPLVSPVHQPVVEETAVEPVATEGCPTQSSQPHLCPNN